RLPFAAQDVDGSLHVAAGFRQRVATVAKTGAGAFTQLLDQLRGYIGLLRVCRHFGKSSNDGQILAGGTKPGASSPRNQGSDSPSAGTVCPESLNSGVSTKSPSCFS